GGADDEAAPAVPQPRQLSPGSATGPGDQVEPTGLPHDRRGSGRGRQAVRVEGERSPRDGCWACGPRGQTGRHGPRHHGPLDRRGGMFRGITGPLTEGERYEDTTHRPDRGIDRGPGGGGGPYDTSPR